MGERKIKKFVAPAERPIYAIDASPNGDLLAIGQQNGDENSPTLSLVDLKTGAIQQIIEKTTNYEGSVYQVAFYPRGEWLLYIVQQDEGFQFKGYDLSTSYVQHFLNLGVHRAGFTIDAEGNFAITGKNLVQMNQIIPQKLGHEIKNYVISQNQNPQICSAISPDGKLIVISGPEPGSIDLYDRVTGQIIRTLTAPFSNIGQIEFDSSSQYIAASDLFGHGIFLWNTQTGQRYLENIFNEEVVLNTCMKLSSKSHHIALGHLRGYVDLYDLKNGDEIFSDREHRGRIEVVCFALDGNCLISGGEDHKIIVRYF